MDTSDQLDSSHHFIFTVLTNICNLQFQYIIGGGEFAMEIQCCF